MTDVFISYKRRLRPVVEHLAEALRGLKINVWFDARLEPGEQFSDEISREVRRAGCVLVCWSNDAFPHGGDKQAWVRGEAQIGQDRGTLVSVQVEPTDFDPPWNMMHHEDLVGWSTPKGLGAPTDPRWLNVLDAIGRKLNRPGLRPYVEAAATGDAEALAAWTALYPDDPLARSDTAPPPPRPVASPQTPPRTWLWLAVGGLAVAAAALAAIFLMPGEPSQSAFKTTMLGYCAETPQTITYECGCMADVLERELDETAEAIFVIIGKPGATGDEEAVNRLLRDAGYTQPQIDAAGTAIQLAVAKVAKECPAVKPGA